VTAIFTEELARTYTRSPNPFPDALSNREREAARSCENLERITELQTVDTWVVFSITSCMPMSIWRDLSI
jgi:hypothetical protein